jgi:hypothetical protein
MVLLTAFRKTRHHDQKHIDRVQQACEHGHQGSYSSSSRRLFVSKRSSSDRSQAKARG